jgi:ketol-acid reductoisomerase
MRVLGESDADLRQLQERPSPSSASGYQGAQSLNLRDSGIPIVIGSLRDQSAEEAESDGFEVLSIAEACGSARRHRPSDPG